MLMEVKLTTSGQENAFNLIGEISNILEKHDPYHSFYINEEKGPGDTIVSKGLIDINCEKGKLVEDICSLRDKIDCLNTTIEFKFSYIRKVER